MPLNLNQNRAAAALLDILPWSSRKGSTVARLKVSRAGPAEIDPIGTATDRFFVGQSTNRRPMKTGKGQQ
jgi:hypothetical protein